MAIEMKSMTPLREVSGNENKAYQRDIDSPSETTSRASYSSQVDAMENGVKHEQSADNVDPQDESDYNGCQRWLMSVQSGVTAWYDDNHKVLWTVVGLVLALAYFAYFGYAMYYRFGDEGSWRLLGYTVFGVCIFVISKIHSMHGEQIKSWWEENGTAEASSACRRFSTFISWLLPVGVFIAVVVYVIIDIAIDHPENLVSIVGLVLYVIIFYVTSINPAKVNWRTVYWGIALQYVFALVILRTKWGYDMFDWLGDRVSVFLEYATAGVVFVFGDSYADHFFVTKVLGIVIFFFAFVNILYYLGVMQTVIGVMGRFLSFCMDTTPAESINAAGNIFVSMSEAPAMIRPFIKDMTNSELHAVMTGGFATIAGSVLGAYISFGVPANHLLSASVMSAPAALAISKLSYPELQNRKNASKAFISMERPPEGNMVEAASNGASNSLKIIGNIAVNVLAFLALLQFLNSSLSWFGNRVGIEDLSFELICSYVLYPVSYFMGVERSDCRTVAELIGVKTFTNEFIAYGQLKVLIENRHTLDNYTTYFNTTDWYWKDDNVILNITGEVLEKGVISLKSEIISTYALCGFANFGSMGIQLGALGTMAPSRKSDLSKMVVRAMICGNVACFLTACVAGLLYKPF